MLRIDITYLIDRLETLLNRSRRVPLTSAALVSRDECLEIIDQMRITLPQQIEEARRIQEEREQVLALAHEEAKRVVEEAHEEAEHVLNERGLLEEAQDRSQAILEESRRQAEEIMTGADEYAIGVLGRLEDQLIAVQTTIRNGLDALQEEGGKTGASIGARMTDSTGDPDSEHQ